LCPETVNGLKNRFKDFVVVYAVKAEGELDGTFHLVFDRQGLFILAGIVAMHPENMIQENIESGSLEKADEITNIVMEVGDALIGAWDRIFKKALDGHGRFGQTNIFIGSPWDDSKKKIGVAGNEKSMFVPIEMTVGSFPVFNCGVIFPKTILVGTSESKSKEPKADEDVKEAESEDPNVSEAVEEPKPQEPADQKDVAQKTKAQENTKETAEAEGHPKSKNLRLQRRGSPRLPQTKNQKLPKKNSLKMSTGRNPKRPQKRSPKLIRRKNSKHLQTKSPRHP
jgi:hypothetical protein